MLSAVRIRYPGLVWSKDTLECRQPFPLKALCLLPLLSLILKSGLLCQDTLANGTAATNEQPDTAKQAVWQPERIRDNPPNQAERGQQEFTQQFACDGQKNAHKKKAAPQKQGGNDQAEKERGQICR